MIRILFALLLAFPAFAHEPTEAIYAFEVTRVVDADTFDGYFLLPGGTMTPARVRVACIQAPERYSPDGKVLKMMVAQMLEDRTVFLTDEGDGGFGRILSHVHVPGVGSLSRWLYHNPQIPSPLYTGSATTKAAIDECRQLLD